MHSQASKDGFVDRNTAETMGFYETAASEELRNDYTPRRMDTENSSDKNRTSAGIDRTQ
jgi:hypothetical protein